MTEPTSPPRLTYRRAADVIAAPVPVDVIEGIAAEGQVSLLPAESGTGKTFVLLDLHGSVGDGTPWHGRETQQGSTVHVTFEGDQMNLRLRAVAEHTSHSLERLVVITACDPISPRLTREGEERSMGYAMLADALSDIAIECAAEERPPIRLVTVDTVRASMSGNEDASEATAAYLRAIRQLMTLTPRAAWILSHHTGWQDGEEKRKRERGSSAWRGNVDATLYLERTGEYDRARGTQALRLSSLKMRDGDALDPLHLVRRRVDLGITDRYGRPLTSCVISPDSRTPEDRSAALQAATTAATQAQDLVVLTGMRDSAATNVTSLRAHVGLSITSVTAAVSRIQQRGWARAQSRGKPFLITETGIAALARHPEQALLNVTERYSGNVTERYPFPPLGNGNASR